jgi:hypothetical protein
MSLQGLQTPNSINLLAQLLSSNGLNINATAAGFMGSSVSEANYVKGTIGSTTVLNKLIDAINLAYGKIGAGVTQATYDALISIGSSTIPALGNSKPATYIPSYTNSLSRWGFIRLPALQAYNEFVTGGGAYKDFCLSFITAISFRDSTNPTINSLANSVNYLQGVYSNMNDLITADITGVNLSTLYWGQDLINSGRAIDLSNIDIFGLPSVLLKTLQQNSAITQALSYALIFSGLTTTEINNFLNGGEISISQEQKIYSAFTTITGNDLTDILIPLNVQTTSLQSLADLLNPIKLFPNSFSSLTVPQYNTNPEVSNSSKIYYPIYSNGSVNPNLDLFNFGDYLLSILPENLRISCGAFANAMMQIRNIKNVPIERFAQVVTNLEYIDAGLNLVNGNTGTPVNQANVASAIATIALGSGTNGTYLATDFFGAMTGLNYNYNRTQQLILQLQSSNLATIYTNIFNKLNGAGPYDADVINLVGQANTEITNIKNANAPASTELNTIWNQIGTNLSKETSSRTAALPSNATSTTSSITSFVDNINSYALDTGQYQSAAVLEAIANTTTLGGQSLIALMREIRNANRLGLCGLELDNNISNSQTVTPQSTIGNVTRVTGATTVPGSFAGSPETDLVPFNLDIFNVSTSVSVPVQTPNAALQNVIDCNCDCWDLL